MFFLVINDLLRDQCSESIITLPDVVLSSPLKIKAATQGRSGSKQIVTSDV